MLNMYVYKTGSHWSKSSDYLTRNWSLIRLIFKVSLIVDMHIYLQKSLPAKMSENIKIFVVRQF